MTSQSSLAVAPGNATKTQDVDFSLKISTSRFEQIIVQISTCTVGI
jgi:hypothetical protein